MAEGEAVGLHSPIILAAAAMEDLEVEGEEVRTFPTLLLV